MNAAGDNPADQLDLKDRQTFNIWTSHTIRYNDLDPLGHVNNAVYSTFFEAGRTAFMQPVLDEMVAADQNIDFVLARVIIDFVQELRYPGTVDIGTRVSRLGTKSMSFVNSIFKGGTNECVATGQAVLVFFDLDSRKSVEPPPQIRAFLESTMRSD